MATRICPKCGAENPEGASFCGFCRAELGPATSAGTEGVVAGAEGVATGASGVVQPAPQPAPEPAPQPTPQPAPAPAAAQPKWQPASPPPQGAPAYQPPQGVPATPFAPPPQPPAKKKSPVKIIIFVVVGLLLLCGIGAGVATCAAFGTVNAVADSDYYEIGGEKVPSVKLALGEKRTVTSVASETVNGLDKQTIIYSVTTNQAADMNKYFDYLQQQGFITTKDYDFTKPAAEGYQVAKNSADVGKVVVVTINYNSSGYDVTLDKADGSVTSNSLSTNISTNNNSPTNNSSNALMAAPYLQIFESGNFHAAFTVHASNSSTSGDDSMSASLTSDVEMWVKGQQTATHMDLMGMTIRMIFKDNKAYTIMDDLKTMQVSSSDSEYDFSAALQDKTLSYKGSGTDSFLGQQFEYEEYQSSDGSNQRYYFNASNGNLIGIQSFDSDGTVNELEFTVLDKNVPDSVFELPTGYTVIEG